MSPILWSDEVVNQVQEHTMDFAVGCVQQRTVEQCVDVPAPQFCGRSRRRGAGFLQERISEDAFLPPIQEEHVKVVKLDTQECVQQPPEVGWTGQQEHARGHVRVFLHVGLLLCRRVLGMCLGALELGRLLVRTRRRRWALQLRRAMVTTRCRRCLCARELESSKSSLEKSVV